MCDRQILYRISCFQNVVVLKVSTGDLDHKGSKILKKNEKNTIKAMKMPFVSSYAMIWRREIYVKN